MRESADLRIAERHARSFLNPEDGIVLGPFGGDVRKLVLETNDSRYAKVGMLQREFRKRGSLFFMGWSLRRKYTKKELDAAGLFQLCIPATVEPDGSQCGTEYDDSTGCPHCCVGARQLNELRLDPGSLPRRKDIARTIAYSEVIFSARLVEAMREHGITGARFLPVLRKGGSGVIDSWYQLEVASRPVGVAPVTRFGIDPLDLDEQGEHRCPLGHVAGLNILSELSVKREDWDGSDVCATKQWVGYRSRNGGVFRPNPLLLVSQKLRRVLGELKARGYELEVAHLL
jgi:hypothetical protein